MIKYSLYGTLDLVAVYVALLVVTKMIYQIREIFCNFLIITAIVRYPLYVLFARFEFFGVVLVLICNRRPKYDSQTANMETKQKQEEAELMRGKYITYTLNIINSIFLVHLGRVALSLIWLVANFMVSLVMRPFLSNPLLFGLDADSRKFSFLSELRKTRQRKHAFGLRVN